MLKNETLLKKNTRCSGQWTESRYKSFICSALRSASNRWSPKYSCKKNARVSRNVYLCSSCNKTVGSNSIRVDHINPVVDPIKGFCGWDQYIARLFVESDGFRAICETCHSQKTNEERELRKQSKRIRLLDAAPLELNGCISSNVQDVVKRADASASIL